MSKKKESKETSGQPEPALQSSMEPPPKSHAPRYKGADKLGGKAALITGGDSGIGRAVTVLYAREGADVAITPGSTGGTTSTRGITATGGVNTTVEGGPGQLSFLLKRSPRP